jgi:polar amino acid transport system permease protein
MASAAPIGGEPAGELTVVPRRHVGRWITTAAIALFAAMLIHSLFFSHTTRNGQRDLPRYEWGVVGHYFFTKTILLGLTITLEVTALAMVLGIVIGVLLAVVRLSESPVISGSAWTYIWFFRGTPVFVQIIFWYNISYLYPTISLGVPFWHSFVTIHTNSAVSAIVAGVLALGLNEGAYYAEIVRAGIISVDPGQTEAASSLGMTRLAGLRRIVLPQAMRLIIPVTGNETISMLKTSSLVSVITVGELLFKAQAIYNANYETVPLLMVASLWYLIVTTVLTIGQFFLERRYSRGQGSNRRVGFLEDYWNNLRNVRRAPTPPVAREVQI